MNPLDFLQSVAGFAQANQPGFDITKMRLATVDPAYVSSTYPGTLPKVTFDGETTLSGKRYPVMSPYLPTPGDRVLMVPLGATYLIIGPTDQDASLYVGGSIEAGGGADITGTARIRNSAATDVALASVTSADSFDRVRMDASGAIAWGPGNATRDTNLYRSAADTLKTDDSLEVAQDITVGDDVFLSSGSVATWAGDTNLYRSAANTLKTDDSLEVGGSINASGIVYSVAYSGTTDGSGFLTITHGAPWTPVAGWAITTNPASSFAQVWGIDNIGATTCRLRIANANGGALASSAISGRLFLIK